MSRPPEPAIAIELELRRTEDAEVEGPYDRVLLTEMLYTGAIDERACVREAGEAGWRGIHEDPALVAILRLLGRAPSVGRRAVAGWASKEAAPRPVPATALEAPQRPSRPLSLWWVGLIAAVVAAAVAWLW